jgi:ADP-ribosylglycohydrolase
MTIAVAEWLLTPPFNKENLTKIMQKWGRKYRNAGYGHLFGQWIDSDDPQPYNSFGNGSAMRVSPVGCAFQTQATTLEIAELSASVSHNHPEGIKGAKCIADAIWYVRTYGEHFDKKDFITWLTKYYLRIELISRPEWIIKAGYKFDSTCQGSVPEAICCFLCSNSYEETIRNAIMLRGDADTQAAIAGSIAAAYWGIPDEIAIEAEDRLPDDMYDVFEEFSEKYDLDF